MQSLSRPAWVCDLVFVYPFSILSIKLQLSRTQLGPVRARIDSEHNRPCLLMTLQKREITDTILAVLSKLFWSIIFFSVSFQPQRPAAQSSLCVKMEWRVSLRAGAVIERKTAQMVLTRSLMFVSLQKIRKSSHICAVSKTKTCCAVFKNTVFIISQS